MLKLAKALHSPTMMPGRAGHGQQTARTLLRAHFRTSCLFSTPLRTVKAPIQRLKPNHMSEFHSLSVHLMILLIHMMVWLP